MAGRLHKRKSASAIHRWLIFSAHFAIQAGSTLTTVEDRRCDCLILSWVILEREPFCCAPPLGIRTKHLDLLTSTSHPY